MHHRAKLQLEFSRDSSCGYSYGNVFLFMGTATYMQNIGKNGTAVKVLEALCTYNRKRANTNHKEVIVRAISQMGGDGPEAVRRIGDAEQPLFTDDTSLYAGDFTGFMETACRIWDVQKMPCMRLNSVCRFEKQSGRRKLLHRAGKAGMGYL